MKITLQDIRAKQNEIINRQNELQEMLNTYNKQEENKKVKSDWITEEGDINNYYIEYDGVKNASYVDETQLVNLNAFKTVDKAEEIAFKQLLFRRLQKFSDENGGDRIDWRNQEQYKYFISFNTNDMNLHIGNNIFWRFSGVVFFISKEVTGKAIELFKDDLIKYFTEY